MHISMSFLYVINSTSNENKEKQHLCNKLILYSFKLKKTSVRYICKANQNQINATKTNEVMNVKRTIGDQEKISVL